MLMVCDDRLLDGTLKLHDWQVEILTDFSSPSDSNKPYRASVRAANGSGKDNFIVAPCAVWMCLAHESALVVITSASGNQLDRQTDKYIKQLTNTQNRLFGTQVWKQNYRRYENLLNGSMIEMFVTDEPGRAEGWHPVVPNGQFAILSSEAKSIPEDIFTALARCTGFTKRVDVSSPGLPTGHFYNTCISTLWKQYHITAFDCPHLSGDYIDEIKDMYGEASSLYKSMVLAEFGGLEEQVVMNYNTLNDATDKVEEVSDNYNCAGLDLSAGGDEQVLVVRCGNHVVGLESFRYHDTTLLVEKLGELFYRYNLDNANSVIYGDAGGLGKPILDQLRRDGWNIKYVLNQAKPYNALAYLNRGAELWFSLARHIENFEIVVPKDTTLRKQLASRYYLVTPQNKLQLESKRQAKAKGHASPDRADAFVLAFADYRGILPKKTKNRGVMLANELKEEPDLPEFQYLENRLERQYKSWPELKGLGNHKSPSWLLEEIEEYNRKLNEKSSGL